MSSRGEIQFRKVLAMLDRCAEGYTRQLKKHLIWIRYQGKVSRLPKGRHGKAKNFMVEIGHVRSMIRNFGIEECAKGLLPQL